MHAKAISGKIYTIKLTKVIPRDGNPTIEGLGVGEIVFFCFIIFKNIYGLELKHMF